MSAPRSGPEAVGVVVPAHDEAADIGRCLDAIATAAERLREECGIAATVTVVADTCSDDTVAIARGRGADVVTVTDRCVGRARAAGAARVLAAVEEPARAWLAMTDADSAVSPDWLLAQVVAAAAGAELWLGRVRPDPATLPAGLLREWTRLHRRQARRGLPRVYGASLGVAGDLYLRAGGMPPLPEHEDVAFVRQAVAAGAIWVAGTAWVETSGRCEGRTPGGFAGYLRALAAQIS
ncbi:MAG: glycosyltransferase [Nocardioides sp.]|uniref:glycosyltransferase family 2 protein n=1 Tax=Nocardioides sp. TaxID=35761 RepID=UPI0039E6A85A